MEVRGWGDKYYYCAFLEKLSRTHPAVQISICYSLLGTAAALAAIVFPNIKHEPAILCSNASTCVRAHEY